MVFGLLVILITVGSVVSLPEPAPDFQFSLSLKLNMDPSDKNKPPNEVGYSSGLQDNGECSYNGIQYNNSDPIENICLQITCQNGEWQYTGQGQPISTCGECQVWGDPQFYPYSSPYFGRYYSYQGTGTYTITQNSVNGDASLIVTSYFEPQGYPWGDYTAPRLLNYFEPGFDVTILLPSFQNKTCYEDSGSPECYIKTYVKGAEYHMRSTVLTFNATAGEVLIFESNHINSNLTRCINIVGASGISLSLCMSGRLYYSFLYIWPMPSLKNKLYGLCDKYQDIESNEYTMKGGQATTNIVDFANSWQTSSLIDSVYYVKIDDDKSIDKKNDQDKCTQSKKWALFVEKECNDMTAEVCKIIPPYKCDGFKSGCKFDLCHVPYPDLYKEGFADHLLIESHFNKKN